MNETRKPSDRWVITVVNERYFINRQMEGFPPTESYAPVDRDRAAVFVAAVIQGFEPPRVLRRLDTPFEQTPPAPATDRVA